VQQSTACLQIWPPNTDIENSPVASQCAHNCVWLVVSVAQQSTACQQISPPKTDIENNVIISDYAQMDRILKVSFRTPLNSVKYGGLFVREPATPRWTASSRWAV